MATTTKPTTSALDTSLPVNRIASGYGFRQTLSNALIITRREVRDSFRDWRIIAPIIILTFFFPFLAQNVAASFANFLSDYGAELIGERTIPFLLMIVGFFPISISLVIALETFVGEKERRSLEPLLSTPLTNTELYIGKTLAAMIPPLIASFGGMTVYLIMLMSGELIWQPEPLLIVQIFMLTFVQALVMVTGAVVVSSQTTSTRASNLLASFIIIPMTLLINGESVIMFLAPDAESPNGIGALWAIIVGMIVVVLLLLRVGNSIFNREELLGRTIDQLKLRNSLSKIWRWARAVDDEGNTAINLWDWYRRAIPYSLRKLGAPVVIAIAIFVLTFAVGFAVGQNPEWQLPISAEESNLDISTMFDNIIYTVSGGRLAAFQLIVVQNARILIAALLLSIFTFGVASLILTPIVYGVIGYALSQFILAGFDLSVFFAALVPHGIIEVPVILLATATALRLGAVVTRPPEGFSVGHAWTTTMGDSIKLFLGLVIPGLIFAALIEVFITPVVVRLTLGG